MSISVCRPLKRAKSTVGVPEIRLAVAPPLLVSVTLLTTTGNETTDANGASVPTKKAGPVVELDCVVAVVVIELVHPVATRAIAVARRSASLLILPIELGDILVWSLSAILRGLYRASAE